MVEYQNMPNEYRENFINNRLNFKIEKLIFRFKISFFVQTLNLFFCIIIFGLFFGSSNDIKMLLNTTSC